MKKGKNFINLARLLLVVFCFSIFEFNPRLAKATEEFKETIINDFTTGNAVNQFKYSGTWGTSTNLPNLFHNGDEHWALISKGAENAANTYYTIKFEGEKIEIYGDKSPVLGKYAISVNDGEEVIVDAYNVTKLHKQLLFESEVLEKGVHTVTVKGTGLSSGAKADMQVDFAKVFSTPTKPTSVELSQASINMEENTVQNLTATVRPDNAEYTTLTWSSDDESVATVDATGLVTAVAPGITNVNVAIEGTDLSASCEITVTKSTATEYFNTIINDFDIGADINQFKYFGNWGTSTGLNGLHNGDEHWSAINIGASNASDVYAEVRFEGNKIELYGTKDPNHGKYAVSIDGGAEVIVNAYNSTRIHNQKLFESPLLAHGVHTLKVRATGESDGGQASIQLDYAKIQHEEIKATAIDIVEKQAKLEAGGTFDIAVKFTPANTSVKELIYSSDNTNVATVDENGTIAAVAPGTANITAAIANSDLASSMTIEVIEANEFVGGFIATTERHFLQEDFDNYFGKVDTFESLAAWRNDIAVSKLVLYTKDNAITNLDIKVNDLVNGNNTIASENVEFTFLKEVKANLGGVQPGQGLGQVVPNQPKQDIPEILYSSEPMNSEARKLQQAWIEFNIPTNAKPGVYTTTIEVTADELSEPLVFDYEVEVLDIVQPTYEESDFHLDLWQYPYSVARYYEVEPFSPEHLEILKPHMELYKEKGGKTITTTIVQDAWNHQTYDVYDSMIKWTKKLDGTFEFDYTHFDKWVQFNLDLGITDQISIFSIVPWENRVIYFDEATGDDVAIKAAPGTPEWNRIWNQVLDSLVAHLDEKGWFDLAYIAMDERPIHYMLPALDLIDSKPNKEGNTLKVSGAMNYSSMDRDVLNRIDDISIHASHTNHHNDDVRNLAQERRDLGLKTTLYTCTGSYPSNFTRSEPSDNIWTIWYSAYHETDGYLRWALDSWVEDPLMDSSHWYFEAGDTFLMYPGDKGTENIQARSSIRLEKMHEAIRDVEKINYIKKNAPELEGEIDEFLRSIDRYSGYGNGYGMAEGDAATKDAIANEAIRIKKEVVRISKMYLDLQEPTDIVVSKVRKLKATSTSNQVNLTWDTPKHTTGLDSYIIYKDGKIVDTIDTDTTNYTVNNLKSNNIYNFKVVAKYSNGEKSSPVSVNIRTGIGQ